MFLPCLNTVLIIIIIKIIIIRLKLYERIFYIQKSSLRSMNTNYYTALLTH